MRIESVEIKNGCQHRSFKGEFGPGVVVVEGPNGSGKSNLIKLIVRGLTGVSLNYGKKEDDLTWGEGTGVVKVDFSAGGQRGFIQRSLKNASCRMEFGEKKFKTAKDIDSAIYDILGVSSKILAEIVMAQQGRIESVLFQAPAERAKSMQELFGTLQAEKIRGVLADDLANTPAASRAAVIKSMQDKLATDILAPLKEAAGQVENLKKDLLSDEDLATSQGIVQEYLNQSQNQVALEKAQAAYKTVFDKLQDRRSRFHILTDILSKNEQVINDLRELIATLSEKINTADSRRSLKQQRDAALQELARHEAVLRQPEPQQPHTKEELAELNSRFSENMNELTISQRLVNSVGQQNKCPVCQSDVPPETVTKHMERIGQIQPVAQQLEAEIHGKEAAMKKWTAAHAQWAAEVATARRQHVQLQQQISEIPDYEVPSAAELEEDRKTVADFQKLERSQVEANAERVQVEKDVQSLEADALRLSEEVKAAEAKQVEKSEGAAYTTARDHITKHEHAKMTLASLDGRIQTLREQQESTEKSIEELKNEEARLERIKEWRELVDRARSLLHRDQLPNLVAQAYVKAINRRLAKYLEMFEVPYTCMIGSDLSVICAFSGGRQLPAERLSGGEKVMLGIAFRFAIYDMFASNLGLLILDEPTVFLDSDRIDAVYELLERVKSYSKSAGLQLIVVTHEKRLAGVADRVISL